MRMCISITSLLDEQVPSLGLWVSWGMKGALLYEAGQNFTHLGRLQSCELWWPSSARRPRSSRHRLRDDGVTPLVMIQQPETLGKRNKVVPKLVSWVHWPITFLLPHSFAYTLLCPHPKRALVASFPFIRSQQPMKIKAKITRNQKLDYGFFEGKEDLIFKTSLRKNIFHFIILQGVVVLFLSMEGSLLEF